MGIGQIGVPGLILIAVVVLVLFGRGKVAALMGEVGKGITAFKKGVAEGGKELDDKSAEAEADSGTAASRDVTPEEAHDKDKV
jgi:sec-independent protein translocase protein TatA